MPVSESFITVFVFFWFFFFEIATFKYAFNINYMRFKTTFFGFTNISWKNCSRRRRKPRVLVSTFSFQTNSMRRCFEELLGFRNLYAVICTTCPEKLRVLLCFLGLLKVDVELYCIQIRPFSVWLRIEKWPVKKVLIKPDILIYLLESVWKMTMFIHVLYYIHMIVSIRKRVLMAILQIWDFYRSK